MENRPHVIVIMADQLREDVLSPEVTPHICKLLTESFRFQRAYCASPLCVPARGSFFTGRYPNETGCVINPWTPAEKAHGLVASGTPNLYQHLEDDWDSWHVGKQHFLTADGIDRLADSKTNWRNSEEEYGPFLREHGKRAPGGERFRGIVPEMAFGTTTRLKKYSIPTTGCYEEGFDYFFDGFILDTALKAIRDRDRSKPMLLNAMFLAPHPPLDIPEPWYSRFNREEIALPDNVGRWSAKQSPLQLYNLTGAVGSRYSREDWHEIWKTYLGLVSLLDDCVGQMIDELKKQGMYEDALIVFTSDHGEMLGSHGLWQKMCMYEESVRIPLGFKFPQGDHDQYGGGSSDEPVSAIDVFPTLCDYLGAPIPESVTGTSLMEVMNGRARAASGNVFIQFDGNGARGNYQRCIVQGSDKLIVDWFKDEIFLELYDLSNDPMEQDNRIFEESERELIARLLDDLSNHMKRTGDLLQLPPNLYDRFVEQYAPFYKDK
ncbi:sulfatase-like hydrolase/transferase [Paenibacillus sp. HB172176]|uniref:sulfatase family protein n=1 Tax=Paenibacillus sp. HB172176 TaxID=2493690 RepID=UPI001F0F6BCF|nr:sulfatase-like hydrolase/transferase [Paenibacillus sp. HB172176]